MFQRYIDGQYRRPSGIVGRWIGRLMVKQHRPENLWTVGLLDLQPTDQVLEIGFGGGFAIQEVAKHLAGGRASGLDYSRAMVQAAARRNREAIRAGRVDLREGNAAQLPFADNYFDKVFTIHSIYFWSDGLTALRQIKRVLKPGGALVVTLLPTERWENAGLVTPVATPTFTPYSGAELCDLLSEIGFVNTRIETDPNTQYRSNYSVIGQKATSV